MSIFSSIGKAFRRVAGVALPAIGASVGGPIGGILGQAIGGQVAASAVKRTSLIPPSLPGGGRVTQAGLPQVLSRTAPTIGALTEFLPDIGVPGPGVFSSSLPRGAKPMIGGACPAGYHPNKQDGAGGPAGTYCVRNRRMNPMNHRAAMRAIRRVKGARKTLQRIERQLPRQATRRRVQHVPSGYRHK